MINNVRPINTVDDVKGIKWRVMPNPVYIEMFRSLGGNAVPMPWGEVFTALQQGTIDGLECPLAIIYSVGFFEVAKYCSLTNHTYSAIVLIMSKRKFDKLTPEQQDAVLKATRKTIDRQRIQNYKNAQETVAKLKTKGMKVNKVADLKPFQKKVTRVYDKFRSDIGEDLFNQALSK